MKVILVANPKGGCGKTTITTNLACFYARWGFQSLILDVDAQRSSTDWQKIRPTGLPKISAQTSSPGLLPERILQAREQAAPKSLLIIDLPAAYQVQTQLDILGECDLVLLPMLPSPIDTRAMVHHMFDLHRLYFDGAGPTPTAVIANRIRPNSRLQREFTEGFLQRIRFPLLGELRETVNYPRAAADGKGIIDLPVRQVIRDLLQWQGILTWVNNSLWPSMELDTSDWGLDETLSC